MSVEEQRRISDLYGDLNRMDHYRLLGVSATDDAKTIKRAYFALAKEYHPDRWFRRDIGALRPKIDVIFAAMTTALETLTETDKRETYDEYLRQVLKSRIHRRQASVLEASNDWAAAAKIWARIVDQFPTEAYVHHRYAYALLHAGEDHASAVEAISRAIELDSARAEYRVTAASLYLAEGRDQTAVAELRIACELEPSRRDLAALHRALASRVPGGR
jgi:curved DNA-binding protein CbpA